MNDDLSYRDVARLNQLAGRIRLPPGVTLHAGPGGLAVRGEWLDSRGGRDKVVTVCVVRLPNLESVDDRFIESEVYASARVLWMHEFDEWFTVDGVHHHEPHRADGSFA